MPHITTIYCLSLAIVFTTFLGVSWAATDKNTLNKKHHVKRQSGQQSRLNINQFDIRSMLPSQWQQYAPNPPSPEEVDCHIELEVTELIGGRCVRLGGYGNQEGPAVCQSGIHLDIWNDECETIMAERQNNENFQSAHAQQTGQSQHTGQTGQTHQTGQGEHGTSASETAETAKR